jgi:hypothetical protein
MESLVVHAVSLESAQGFCAGLSEFRPKLVEDEYGRYKVEIPLDGNDRAIVAVLHALEEYVTNGGDAPARLGLDGRRATLHPRPTSNQKPRKSLVQIRRTGNGTSMGQTGSMERLAPTAEDAARRIEALRRIYDRGYIARATFETMKSDIEARVKRAESTKRRP